MNTFKQELSAHPRGNIVSHKKKALIIGATGATGATGAAGALRPQSPSTSFHWRGGGRLATPTGDTE